MYIIIPFIGALIVALFAGITTYKSEVEKEVKLIEIRRKIKSGEMDDKLIEFIQDTERRFGDLELNNEKRFNKFEKSVSNIINGFKEEIVKTVKEEVVTIIDDKLRTRESKKIKGLKAFAIGIAAFLITVGSNIGVGIVVYKYQKNYDIKVEQSQSNTNRTYKD